MNKIIASIISAGSLIFGILIILLYGGNGGEGVLFSLGFLGMPLTLIDLNHVYSVSFLYFIQYQLLAYVVFRWVKSTMLSCFIFAILLTYFSFIILKLI